jgi:hypothetical protein
MKRFDREAGPRPTYGPSRLAEEPTGLVGGIVAALSRAKVLLGEHSSCRLTMSRNFLV